MDSVRGQQLHTRHHWFSTKHTIVWELMQNRSVWYFFSKLGRGAPSCARKNADVQFQMQIEGIGMPAGEIPNAPTRAFIERELLDLM